MLIACPYCGQRDASEFTYQGDGNRTRPNPMSQDIDAWNEYVYDRVNVAGDQNEIWQHSGGCRAHLRVVRNTLTHKISSVEFARPDVLGKAKTIAKPAASRPVAIKTTAKLPTKAAAAKPRKPAAKRGAK